MKSRSRSRSQSSRRSSRSSRKSKEDSQGPLASDDHQVSKDLFKAVRANDVQRMRDLLASGCKDFRPNCNIRDLEDPLEPPLLNVACERGYHDIVRILVLRKAEPAYINDPNKRGVMPIWWAARNADAELAKILLEETDQKCEVNYLDPESGCTPLYRAILSNSTEVTQLLIHARADVNLRRLGIGAAAMAESPLIKCVQLNNAEICLMLLNSLCEKEAKTVDGFTALHYAIAYRRYALAEMLLENHVDKMATSNNGATPMVIAIEQQNPAMCRLLIEYGYKMNAPLEWHETPLEMAICCHSEQCALTLVHWGCSIRSLPSKPSYFLHAACEGLIPLMKLLLDRKPSFLNEDWIRNRKMPLTFYKKPAFYEWLCEESSRPRNLKLLCRSFIFQYLGKYACHKIKELPLPKQLLDFVGMKEHINENMYEKITVYSDDCPYDCNPRCDKPLCPELDFSSSEDEDV